MIATELQRITDAMELHRSERLFALFSGGYDSLVSTSIASQHPSFAGVIHIRTGIGIPETTQYVLTTCEARGWSVHVAHPNTTYLQMVIAHGFPGPAQHPVMYRMLKERPLETLSARLKLSRTERLTYVTGVRSTESQKRSRTVIPIRWNRSRVWVAPIHDWSARQVLSYVTEQGLPPNPVKQRLHISGECLCGCFADRSERDEIGMWYPHVDREISTYEALVRASALARLDGVNIPSLHQEWGWTRRIDYPQTETTTDLPLCVNCHAGRSTGVSSYGF